MEFDEMDFLREGSLFEESVIIGRKIESEGPFLVYEAFDKNLNIHGVLEGIVTSDPARRDLFREVIQKETCENAAKSDRTVFRMIENEAGVFVFADKKGAETKWDESSAADGGGNEVKGKKHRNKRVLASLAAFALVACLCSAFFFFVRPNVFQGSADKGIHWETRKGSSLTEAGALQREAGYFESKDLSYADIYLKESGHSEMEFGAKYDSMCELKSYLDAVEYAVGEKEDREEDTKGIVVRIGTDNIAPDIPALLFGDSDDFGCLYLKNTGAKGLYWDAKSKTYVEKLVDEPEDLLLGESIQINAEELSGVPEGSEIAWCLDDYNGTFYYPFYLFGTYRDGKIIFDESNADDDVEPVDFADEYIRIINAKLSVRTPTLQYNYRMGSNDYSDCFFGVQNPITDELISKMNDYICDTTGLECETSLFLGGTVNISDKACSMDNLAEESMKMLNSFLKCNDDFADIKYLGNIATVSINEESEAGEDIVTTVVNFSDDVIRQIRFVDNIPEDKKSICEKQMEELLEQLKSDERFAGYSFEMSEI